jgi:hypothetical protein
VTVFVDIGEGVGLSTSDCAGTVCGAGARIVSSKPPIHRKATNAPTTPSAIFTDQGIGSFWRGFEDVREDAIGAANGDPQCKQNRAMSGLGAEQAEQVMESPPRARVVIGNDWPIPTCRGLLIIS